MYATGKRGNRCSYGWLKYTTCRNERRFRSTWSQVEWGWEIGHNKRLWIVRLLSGLYISGDSRRLSVVCGHLFTVDCFFVVPGIFFLLQYSLISLHYSTARYRWTIHNSNHTLQSEQRSYFRQIGMCSYKDKDEVVDFYSILLSKIALSTGKCFIGIVCIHLTSTTFCIFMHLFFLKKCFKKFHAILSSSHPLSELLVTLLSFKLWLTFRLPWWNEWMLLSEK